MQTVHTVSLDRSVQVRGEFHGYMGRCGIGSLHSLMMRALPGSQESSEVGVSVPSTSQGGARAICRRTRRHPERAFPSCLFLSTNFVRGSKSLYIIRTVKVINSKRHENGENRRRASAEDSHLAKEEVMLLFYQLEIERRLQRALNQDEYETAQVLREKIAEFEQVVARKKQEKMGSLSLKEEVQDTSIKILQLRTELQKNIDQENYSGAARMRDKIAELEAEALLAAAKAKIYENIKYAFRLGQKVKHKIFGYMGVICGMDPVCFESADWIQQNAVEELHGGVKQPFYQVLVDVQTNPSNLVAYGKLYLLRSTLLVGMCVSKM
eukprot:TRINITY_DN6245_c0_g1_i3.p1 TRINITY_DN6245_c0_g1~~TRINITY_DN6245_c0_g1_i3.p1  ORF type:complete len:324 (-),score=62.02 TRINITY_DN6245_c0_g1_i3:289-1260(-)